MRVARVVRPVAAAVLFLGLLTAPAAHAAVPGLVGAYGFEEATGTAVVDASGAGNAGAISGATRSAAGRFGAALSFDGVNDVVNIADSSSLDLSSAMTLEAWVRPTGTGWRTAILKERPSGLAYGMYASTDTSRPSAEITASAGVETRGTAALTNNAWSHIATTFDGASLRLFVNGTQVATKAASGSITVSSGALRIGGNAIWSEYFKGLIDEVRVYNRVLTATEIQADLNAPVVGAPSDTTAPTRPSSLTASLDGDDVALTWAASTDDVGVTGYRVYRGATLLTTTSALTFVAADQPRNWQTYTVVAIDAAGNASPASPEATVKVPDIVPPSSPGGLTVEQLPSSTIRLSWTAATDNSRVDQYRIYRSTQPGFTPDPANQIGYTSGSTTHLDPYPGIGTWYYRVAAVDLEGNYGAPSEEVRLTDPRPAPPRPENPTATTVGATIQLAWEQPSHSASITYRIHRSTVDQSYVANASNQIGTSADPGFVDATPPAGTIFYKVVAVDSYGMTSERAITTALGPDAAPPTVRWSATGGTPACPDLRTLGTEYAPMAAVVLDDRPGATVEVRVDGIRRYGPFTSYVSFDFNAYRETNGTHVLTAVGRDLAGNEATATCTVTVANPEHTIEILSPADGASVGGVVAIATVARENGTEDRAGWVLKNVYVDGVKLASPANWDTRTVANGTHTIRADYLITWLSSTYVFATDSIQVTVDNTISAPTGVSAQEYSTGVRLSWNAVPGATQYRAYRGTTADFTPSGNNLAIATVNTSSSDLRLAPGTYFYKVAGVDSAGQNGAFTTLEVVHTEDETPPTVTLAASCDGRVLSEYIGPVNGTVTDDRGGDVRLEVKVDDTRIYGPAVLTGAFQFNWDTRQFADGPHTMRVIATDLSDNERVFECPWTVDNATLTVPIVVPASPVDGTVTVGFQPKADGAAVTAPVQLRIDGVLVANTPSGPYSYSWDTSALANGPHTIEARMFWPGYSSPQATATATVTVEHAAPPVPSGLVAAYGFDEASGTTVTDSSANASTGTISGATRSTSGKFGGALSFDGVNDLVSVPDANSLDLTTGMTLSAWVRPTALGDWRTVVFKHRPGGMVYGLYANTDTGRPAGIIEAGGEQDARGATALAVDAWSYLTATYDGTNVRLYVNGTLAATRAAAGSITVSSGALQIGGNTVWSEWFKGLIDEVRVYDRALTPAEIAVDRDRPVAGGTT